jgi:hypothetical protein
MEIEKIEKFMFFVVVGIDKFMFVIVVVVGLY